MQFSILPLQHRQTFPNFGKGLYTLSQDEIQGLVEHAKAILNKENCDLFDSRATDGQLVAAPKMKFKVAAQSMEQVLLWLKQIQQGKPVSTQIEGIIDQSKLRGKSIQLPNSGMLSECFGVSNTLMLKALQVLKYRKNLTNLKSNGKSDSYVLNGRGHPEQEAQTTVDSLIPMALRYIQRQIPVLGPVKGQKQGLPKFDDVIRALSLNFKGGETVLRQLFQVFSALGVVHAQKAPVGGLYRLKGELPLNKLYSSAFTSPDKMVSAKWSQKIKQIESATFEPSDTLRDFAKKVGINYSMLRSLRSRGAVKNDPVQRYVSQALLSKKPGEAFSITELGPNINPRNYTLLSNQLNKYKQSSQLRVELDGQKYYLQKSEQYVHRPKPKGSKRKGNHLSVGQRFYTLVKDPSST